MVIEQHIPTIIFARIKNLIPTFQIGLQVVAVKATEVGDDSKNTRQDMAVASGDLAFRTEGDTPEFEVKIQDFG